MPCHVLLADPGVRVRLARPELRGQPGGGLRREQCSDCHGGADARPDRRLLRGTTSGTAHTSATITRLEIITPGAERRLLDRRLPVLPQCHRADPGLWKLLRRDRRSVTGLGPCRLQPSGREHPIRFERWARERRRRHSLRVGKHGPLAGRRVQPVGPSGLVPAVLPVPLDANGSGEISIAIPPLLSTPGDVPVPGDRDRSRLRLGPRSHHDQRSGVDDRVR